jgi:hypothetical protein
VGGYPAAMKYRHVMTLRVKRLHNKWPHKVGATNDENAHTVFSFQSDCPEML